MSGYPIQRLTFGGMLDQSFRLLRDHFVPMTVPFIAVHVPYALSLEALGLSSLGADPRRLAADPSVLLELVSKLAVVLVAFMVALAYAQLAVSNVIADCYLARPTSVLDAARRALRTFMPYIGTSLLGSLAMLVLITPILIVPLVLLFELPKILLVALGLLLLTLPFAFYLAVSWMLIGAIVVVEKRYGTAALKRSRALIKGHFWESFAVMLVSGVLVSMAGGALSVAFAFIPVVGPVLNGIVQAVTTSYMAVVLIVLYVDLRCRHEDFDLQLLARQVATLGGSAAPAPVPQDNNAAAG